MTGVFNDFKFFPLVQGSRTKKQLHLWLILGFTWPDYSRFSGITGQSKNFK